MISYVIDEEDEDQMEIDEDGLEYRKSRSQILTNLPPKVQNLLIFLKQYVEKTADNKFRGLIFVRRRSTAKCLNHIIRHYANAHPKMNIRPEFMIGNNSTMPESIEALLSNKTNKQVLEKFKQNEVNIIVSTSVLEEGIDIQECNLVICYDTPIAFRSYVQTKGRARMPNSQYVVFSPMNESVKIQSKLVEWKEVNSILKNVCI